MNVSKLVLPVACAFAIPAFAQEDDIAIEAIENSGFTFLGVENMRLDVGGDFNEEIQSYWTALTLPLFFDGEQALFIEGQFTWHDPLDEQANIGLVYRRWCDVLDGIVGFNAFYDFGYSRHGNGFDGLGLGAEVLKERCEFRFNYYLPQQKQPVIGSSTMSGEAPTGRSMESRRSSSSTSTTVSNFVIPDVGTFRRTTVTTRRDTFVRDDVEFERLIQTILAKEAAMEGLDVEFGHQLVFLEDCCNLWLFGGYYDFNNPFGGDLNGFQGRLECRLNPHLTLDVAYFTDERLVIGENWYFGIRGSIPLPENGNLLAAIFDRSPTPQGNRWFQRVGRDRRHHMTETAMEKIESELFDRTMSNRFTNISSTSTVEEIGE
ncbi:MAG: hypothetical protein HKN23_16110 [Verrucomicrobiales bacterium]|nr:hypothetical protein [Verrucomicrobiales bacterium]